MHCGCMHVVPSGEGNMCVCMVPGCVGGVCGWCAVCCELTDINTLGTQLYPHIPIATHHLLTVSM